ncbi:hypothetical protein CLR69_21420 [Pectobacterium zantedeschiae]|uniref:Uncharacterized protein n=1 Tax=Pectobacterium zantedeschiae TaxID=2034769 RepID=A0A9X8JEB2_9GAMM|nr:hypothetical protein CLR69_21420 [Pectobacterium zantedeschiae]
MYSAHQSITLQSRLSNLFIHRWNNNDEADLDELADRIVRMLTTTDFYEGMGSGISEIDKNFGYLAYDFIDTDTRYAKSREMERLIK